MAVTIREMHLDDVEPVLGAASQSGVKVDGVHLEHRLSLVACEEGEGEPVATVAAVLCVRAANTAVTMEVMLLTSSADTGLLPQLVSKALVKIQAEGIRACRVRIHGNVPTEHDPLWTGGNWFDRFEQHRAA